MIYTDGSARQIIIFDLLVARTHKQIDRTKMFAFIQLVFVSFIFIISKVSTEKQFKESIKCYLTYQHVESRSPILNMTLGYAYHQTAITSYTTDANEPCSKVGCACFSYRSVCSHALRGSNHHAECTDDDKQNGIIQWHRGWTSQGKCEQMRQQPETYLNLTCCHTDRCNSQPEKVIKIVDVKTPLPVLNIYDHQTPLPLLNPQEPLQQYNDHDHRTSQSMFISHKPPQWNNDYVQYSRTSRLPDVNKPSQLHDNDVHYSTTSRLPETSKSSQVHDSHVNHSTTSRFTIINKPSQLNQNHIRNSSISQLPNIHRPTPTLAYDKSLQQKNTLASRSLSSWMIFFSLVCCYRFMIQSY
ncbi:unnamed protein product [Rotaria sp. Silwood2]|nr:unnamed protein product [Rotaria sp. Silwood2]